MTRFANATLINPPHVASQILETEAMLVEKSPFENLPRYSTLPPSETTSRPARRCRAKTTITVEDEDGTVAVLISTGEATQLSLTSKLSLAQLQPLVAPQLLQT